MTDTDSDKLEPCPFCGGEAASGHRELEDDKVAYFVNCTECCAATEHHFTNCDWPLDEARKRWNTRPTTPVSNTEEGEYESPSEVLADWFNGANIQGTARMESVEMQELCEAMQSVSTIPAGYRLVPVEPTEEMIGRGKDALYAFHAPEGLRDNQDLVKELFQWMLSAAPTPEQESNNRQIAQPRDNVDSWKARGVGGFSNQIEPIADSSKVLVDRKDLQLLFECATETDIAIDECNASRRIESILQEKKDEQE